MTAVRRTQAERRETTIGALLDATIAILGESGYSQLTVATVCERAELSQGALFRHFPSRLALIAAATEEVCRRHHALLADVLKHLRANAPAAAIEALIATLRRAARTAEHAAWHEVMVASRTDEALRALVGPTLQAFERSLLDEVGGLKAHAKKRTRLGTVILSVMHMLDSEAVTAAVYDNPKLVADRTRWLVDLLRRELGECLS